MCIVLKQVFIFLFPLHPRPTTPFLCWPWPMTPSSSLLQARPNCFQYKFLKTCVLNLLLDFRKWLNKYIFPVFSVNRKRRTELSYQTKSESFELEEAHTDIAFVLWQTLLDSGAKYIVVQGLPPVGCLPCGLSSSPMHDRDKTGCAATANSAIMIHNQILQRKLADFRTKYATRTILYADYWNAYMTILMNPTKYNFREPFKACCGAGGGKLNFNFSLLCGSKGTSTCDDPGKYINWDGIHLTEAMYRQVADLLLNQGFCQPVFDKLIQNKSGM